MYFVLLAENDTTVATTIDKNVALWITENYPLPCRCAFVDCYNREVTE